MTWPFENDTSNIEKKLAKRSLHHERQRNLFAIIALALTAYSLCLCRKRCAILWPS